MGKVESDWRRKYRDESETRNGSREGEREIESGRGSEKVLPVGREIPSLAPK